MRKQTFTIETPNGINKDWLQDLLDISFGYIKIEEVKE